MEIGSGEYGRCRHRTPPGVLARLLAANAPAQPTQFLSLVESIRTFVAAFQALRESLRVPLSINRALVFIARIYRPRSDGVTEIPVRPRSVSTLLLLS